jgi:hypothetical protein
MNGVVRQLLADNRVMTAENFTDYEVRLFTNTELVSTADLIKR